MAGLYVHIPFCRSRCLYCGFYSTVLPSGRSCGDMPGCYAAALVEELKSRKEEFTEPVRTIYFGGGTPSLLPATVFEQLVEQIRAVLSDLWQVGEFTIEVNPDDYTPERGQAWTRAGVNRFSVGVQSFVDEELRRIGRRHSVECAAEVVRSLGETGNVSVDLICGLPSQTLDSWNQSLSRALELRPRHLSLYTLSFDKGSAFSRMLEKGTLPPLPSSDTVADMYLGMCRRLAAAGYGQYEVSNFALPGFRSRHNSSYWRQTPYIGIGAAAASYNGNDRRRLNVESLAGYLADPVHGYVEEILDKEDLRTEYLLTRLRQTGEGIDMDDFRRRFGNIGTERLLGAVRPFIADGLLETIPGGYLRFTGPKAMLLQDLVLREII